MIIETLTWGSLEVEDEQIYHFSKGIPGFDEEVEYALIEDDGPFVYLQSTRDKSLAFLMADPFSFYPEYEFELPEADAEELEIDSQIRVLGIITLKREIEESTMNLLAPVVLNTEKHLGKQVVLHQAKYQTKHPLWTQQSSSAVSGKVGD